MAHFRAVVRGSRGAASRLGTKTSGISTLLQTWGWDVQVDAWHSSGEDVAMVVLVNHSTDERRWVADLDLSNGRILDSGSLLSNLYATARLP